MPNLWASTISRSAPSSNSSPIRRTPRRASSVRVTASSSAVMTSALIVGANDWAAAWATDGRNEPQFSVEPGGETQREMAYRFGINLVMYALTGNYKADQLHVGTILDRLGR